MCFSSAAAALVELKAKVSAKPNLARFKKTRWVGSVFVDFFHRENGVGPFWMGAFLIINPMYILYSGYLLGTSPFKGLLGRVKQLGAPIPRGPHPFSPLWSLPGLAFVGVFLPKVRWSSSTSWRWSFSFFLSMRKRPYGIIHQQI